MATSDSWIELRTTSGTGDGDISIVVDGNNSQEQRIGVVNIIHNFSVMESVVVVQEGRPSILETDVTEIHAPIEGGSYTVVVTANQTWRIEKDVEWVSCIPASGSGNGEFLIKIPLLASAQSRSTELRIYGGYGGCLVIPVTQSN